jgi:peptide/nickel transport system substrate-binding protein
MLSRRRGLALGAGAFCLAAALLPIAHSGATSTLNENSSTLQLSLPGPFTGCSYLDPGATVTSDAILDLVRPSAFLTNFNGTLVGAGGAIASAELISLSPQTVRYNLSPEMVWSDGLAFNGADLVDWWQRARALASVTSDGYRAIKSLVVATNGLSVTATFATPYADWDLLFRDMEAPGTTPGCAIANLASRPSLGPYEVKSATLSRIVLAMNPKWPLNTNRYGRIVITDNQNLPAAANASYADYTLALNSASIVALSSHPLLESHIGSSNNVEELTFAPGLAATRQRLVRAALSLSINRQAMIDKLFGSITYSPSVAASAIYSQGQSQYPGPSGSNLGGQSTTTTTTIAPTSNTLSDCATCAISDLERAGYSKTAKGWVSDSSPVPLTVPLGVGASDLDHAVSRLIIGDWRSLGVRVQIVKEKSDIAAAGAAASGRVDAALFARPTQTNASYAARSWAGPSYRDTYQSGVRIAAVTSLFTQAASIFNPVTAAPTWLQIDQIIMSDFWVRPLFTAPSLTIWSGTISPVSGSFIVSGFVDQIPSWSKIPISTGS